MTPADESRIRGHSVQVREIAIAGRRYELACPRDMDQLTDDEAVRRRFERDEYMPYWAECWPASLLLAELVAGWDPVDGETGRSPTLLELGCGLGLVSIVALARGFDVIASDYDDNALAFVRENARRNGLPAPTCRYVDWREPLPDLLADRIVASDVLYETRNHRPVAEFVQRHLRPGGSGWIVDCYRQTADAFESIARHCGLTVEIIPLDRNDAKSGEPLRGRAFCLRAK